MRKEQLQALTVACLISSFCLIGCVIQRPTLKTTVPSGHTAGIEGGGSNRFFAYSRHQDALVVRVVDVGAGLCVIVVAPDDGILVYDTGAGGTWCSDAVDALAGDKPITMMIISHGDSDHIGGVKRILSQHEVSTLVWTGDKRTSATWAKAATAIKYAAAAGTDVITLRTDSLEPGHTFALGKASLTFVAGWGANPFPGLDESDQRNAVSIVARVTYGSNSLLLTGDTIGRDRNEGNDLNPCDSAEQAMVENNAEVPLQSTVLVAPHHGGNNSSSNCFIEAIAPKFVIFSAGHEYAHPRQLSIDRYLAAGISVDHLYTTDRGDDEGGDEWDDGTRGSCADRPGDDDIEITIPALGAANVAYVGESAGC